MNLMATIQKLRSLREQADTATVFESDYAISSKWVHEVQRAMIDLFGDDHDLVRETRTIQYSAPGYLGSINRLMSAPYRIAGLSRLRDMIDEAIIEVEMSLGADPIDGRSFDSELWEYVSVSVTSRDWNKVPSDVVIFVEDKVRRISEGDRLSVGKNLFAKAMGNDGVLRLGAHASEHEGWRALGMGLVLAIGNVDRHHIQDREDARKYALGVLGLGSLILTQIRHQYPQPEVSVLPKIAASSGADFAGASGN